MGASAVRKDELREASDSFRPDGYEAESTSEPIYINSDVLKRLQAFCKEHKPELAYSDGIDMLLNLVDE